MPFTIPSRSRFAFEASADLLPPGGRGLFMWTFTFKECLDVEVARRRWSDFLERFNVWRRRNEVEFRGLRVFELHPGGHGLHVHVVTPCYWHVRVIRRLWQMENIGGGRVHVLPIARDRTGYLSKYLRKQGRPACFKGARMWASFGGGDYVRCRDVVIDSDWTRARKALAATLGPTWASLRWYEKCLSVENVLRYRDWHFGLWGNRFDGNSSGVISTRSECAA